MEDGIIIKFVLMGVGLTLLISSILLTYELIITEIVLWGVLFNLLGAITGMIIILYSFSNHRTKKKDYMKSLFTK